MRLFGHSLPLVNTCYFIPFRIYSQFSVLSLRIISVASHTVKGQTNGNIFTPCGQMPIT